MKSIINFPDNKKCPRCGFQMPLLVMPRKGVWKARWNCPACDALLESRPRTLVAMVSVAAAACLPALLSLWGESMFTRVFMFILLMVCLNLFSTVVLATWQAPLDGDRHDKDPVSVRRRRIRERLFGGTLIVIGVYVGFTLLLWGLQSRMLYFPRRDMDATPAEEGLSYYDISFEATDGVKLHGWFVPAENARAVVLFCHGNAGNISHRLDTLRIFRDLRLSTFIFDYRGYGKSEGKPTEEGMYLDVEAAWRHLTEVKGVAPEKIFVHGRSLGGAVAAHLALRHRTRGLILESAFTSVPDRAAELYPILPVRSICRFEYNALEAVEKMRGPVLVIHSPDDTLIPISHGRKLHEAGWFAPRTFLEITGDHNWGFMTSGKVYTEGLDRFISEELRTERHYVD